MGFSEVGLKNRSIGRIERGLLVKGCVVDIVRVYQPVLNEDQVEKQWVSLGD